MDGLAKSFGETQVLQDFSVQLGEGEILALLGLSGSGKTTALRLLAGFETPDHGKILLDGADVTAMAPEKRGFGMVFQHYALFPHMTVAQNVAFGLESRGWEKTRIRARIDEMLALVHLGGFGERRVSAISGGQQQRVALARALAPEPRLLLLDEPLSNLDPALREKTRGELRAAVRRLGITTVLVTHEQEEAFHVGDRIAVLHQGRLQQVGSAMDLYQRPETPFVASFIGRSGRLIGTVQGPADEGDSVGVDLGAAVVWRGRPARGFDAQSGSEAAAVIRPEALTLDGATSSESSLKGKVVEIRFTGAMTYAVVELADPGPHAEKPAEHLDVWVEGDPPQVGAEVQVTLRAAGPVPTLFSTKDFD